MHLGADVDGMVGSFEELTAVFDRYGIERCFVFSLDEPDRHPAFRKPNDRTLAYAERSQGRLIPFARLDLEESPLEEAQRCLDLGARGIKLHPRAQRFLINDERLEPIVALAAERGVPVLIHGGRGLPPIADHLAHLVERYPHAQLIVAHAGIADLEALAQALGGKAGRVLRHLRLEPDRPARFPPPSRAGADPLRLRLPLRSAAERASDGDPHGATGRTRASAELRMILWENADRISRGEPPLAPSKPRGSPTFSQSMTMARIHQYIAMATPLLWTRQPDTVGVLGLALNACRAADAHRHDLQRIGELLTCARDLWRDAARDRRRAGATRANRLIFRLIHLADILAVTSGRLETRRPGAEGPWSARIGAEDAAGASDRICPG